MMIKHYNSASLLTFPREHFLINITLITTVCRNTKVDFIPLSVNPFLLSLKTIVFDIDLILFEHHPQLVPHHFTGIEVKTLEFWIIDVLDDEASFEFSFTDGHSAEDNPGGTLEFIVLSASASCQQNTIYPPSPCPTFGVSSPCHNSVLFFT